MKKYLLFLFISFCICTVANAWLGPHQICQPGGAGGAPASCGGTGTWVGDPGDTETFEFEADDFCTTEFSVTDPDGIISTYDDTESKNGSTSCSMAFTGAGGENDNYIQIDEGAGDGDYTISFWFYAPSVADYQSYGIASSTTTTTMSASTRGYRLYHNHYGGGSFKLAVYGTSNPDDTSTSLDTATWYRVEIDFNQDAASTVEIYNASEVLQDTLNFTGANYAPQYHNFGCLFDDTDANGTVYYDDIIYKSSGGGL